MLLHVKGAKKVQDKLTWLQRQSRRHNNVGVIVGYTASYALWVHEAPGKLKGLPRGGGSGRDKKTGRFKKGSGGKGKFWDPQNRAQPKFLEQPFRELHNQLVDDIYVVTRAQKISKGRGLDKGLMVAGFHLQRESQQLVPVDTGNLKASAFTKLIADNKGKG